MLAPMTMTPQSILAAIDARRAALASQVGRAEPIPYTDVATAIGVHSALFSRLRGGAMPGAVVVAKLAAWVGSAEALECAPCSALDVDDDAPDEGSPADDTGGTDNDGAIVALLPAASDPIMAASSAEPSAHITTVWLGTVTSPADPEAIIAEVRALAEVLEPTAVTPESRGTLGDDGADVVFVSGDGIQEIRDLLLAEGSATRVAFDSVEQFDPWTPHIMLGYPDDPPREDYDVDAHDEIVIDRIAVWIADRYEAFALGGDAAADDVFEIRAVSGRLSDSADPATQADVARVRELLAEGAVGVSVMLDLHPDDAAVIGDAERRQSEAAGRDGREEAGSLADYLPPDFAPRSRIRHTAIVDTPAFADAALSIDAGGALSGPVTFEGIWTGDGRFPSLPQHIDLESTRLPSPIIWDRSDGDHTGVVVGYIDAFERAAAPEGTLGRPVLDDAAITAALAPLEMPASYFSQTAPTGPEPLRIGRPDARGYRAIRGLAAPKGVCHRSDIAACWTWPGQGDKAYGGFHTGTLLRLDNGRDIRVGALTIGGHHLDPALAKRGVMADEAGNHRDDANRVFALVRVWESRFGLMMAGVIPPDVTEGDVARALACSPSIEFWPTGRGKNELIGLHLVPTPGLPVVASVGSASVVTLTESIVLEEGDDSGSGDGTEEIDDGSSGEVVDLDVILESLTALGVQMKELAETMSAILTLIPIDDIEIE